MPNYRYISQGEYFVTTDASTTLITSGMTECIAIAFVDKNNPDNRLLCHLDGTTLETISTATANIERLIAAFKSETQCNDFHTYLLGGQKKFQNWQHLSPALEACGVAPTKIVDSRDFCSELNRTSKFTVHPSNAAITLICPPDESPVFTSFSSKYFNPSLSETALAQGKGLLSPTERIQYQRFVAANTSIIEKDPAAGKIVRHSGDIKLIEKFSASAKQKEASPSFFSPSTNSQDNNDYQLSWQAPQIP